MPEISRFFGIVIRMYYNDHQPPHFHAIYAEYHAVIRIDTLARMRGTIPKRAMSLVLEWAFLHREDLTQAWERARVGEVPRPIPPLE